MSKKNDLGRRKKQHEFNLRSIILSLECYALLQSRYDTNF
uniref:Uncharacterized protein n=1 Tax=Solanum lycopersicum TaxID=4081 RepID=A0A3Q7EKU7_SOLLC